MRVHGLVGLTADASTFADRDGADEVAWSAGVIVGISGTPHTMSIHATNVASRTLQGIARGTEVTRYGFEYTIPISVGRLVSRDRSGRPPHPRPGDASAAGPDEATPAKTLVIDIRSLRYSKRTVEIEPGTTVEWRNRDPLAHTVTSDDGLFDSGDIGAESRWSHTFTTPGTYIYHCAPHPHMRTATSSRSTAASTSSPSSTPRVAACSR